MSDRDVMQQALECLEWHIEAGAYGHDIEGTAGLLRALLAEPEPEPVAEDNLPPMPDPVAWQLIDRLGKERNAPLFAEWQMRSYARVAVDLAAPPTRRPLTDEEIKAAVLDDPFFGAALMSMMRDNAMVGQFRDAIVGIFRAAERAHKIGGNDE